MNSNKRELAKSSKKEEAMEIASILLGVLGVVLACLAVAGSIYGLIWGWTH